MRATSRLVVAALLGALLTLRSAFAAPLLPLDTPPQPMGDELWDTFAAAVWTQLENPQSRPLPRAGLLPAAVLLQWTQLNADPRFWQLRLWTSSVTAQWIDEDSPNEGGKNAMLASMREAGTWTQVIDGRGESTILTHLYRLDLQQKVEALVGREYELPALDDARDDWFDRYDAVVAEGAEFEQLKVAFPDSAWPWYLKALYHARLEEGTLALAELAQGNLKSDIALLPLFPCDKAAELLARDLRGEQQLDLGNLLVAAAVIDAAGVERLPAHLGELTDFMPSGGALAPPSYSAAYPLHDLVMDAVWGHDTAAASTLATFAARVCGTRPHDSRLAVLGLGVGAGLVALSAERWDNLDGSLPATPLRNYYLPNLTSLSRWPRRQILFDSFPPGALMWLLDQRFVQRAPPSFEQWDQLLAPDGGFINIHPVETVTAEWAANGSADARSATAADTVALLNTIGRGIYAVQLDKMLPEIGAQFSAADWATLLPPAL